MGLGQEGGRGRVGFEEAYAVVLVEQEDEATVGGVGRGGDVAVVGGSEQAFEGDLLGSIDGLGRRLGRGEQEAGADGKKGQESHRDRGLREALCAAVPLSQWMIKLYGCPMLRKSDERA